MVFFKILLVMSDSQAWLCWTERLDQVAALLKYDIASYSLHLALFNFKNEIVLE